MAWVSYERVDEGTELSGEYGQPMVDALAWEITVDTENESKAAILAGVTAEIGITWGTAHPDLPALKAMKFKLSKIAPKTWRLDVTYTVPPPRKNIQENGLPKDVWELTGGTSMEPAFRDKDDEFILNAAGDPVEGLEKERDELEWSLTRYYETEEALFTAIHACNGKTNEGVWEGTFDETWKCYFLNAKKVSISKLDGDEDAGTLDFIESKWVYRLNRKTWKTKPWDLGFMELSGSGYRKTIMGDDKKPVKQPVALNPDGTAKAPGEPPDVIRNGQGASLYDTADLAETFGNPHVLG